MRLVVVGATGETGTPVLHQAIDRGHEVVAITRDVDDIAIDHERVTVVAGNAYAGTGIREAVEGADAVICTIWHRRGSPDDLLTRSGANVVEAMTEAGVERYVTLVSADVRVETMGNSLLDRIERRADEFFDDEAVVRDVTRHARRVAESDRRWTVVRAVKLTSDGGPGGYDHESLTSETDQEVAREDVADFLLTIVEEDRHVCELPILIGT